MLEKMNHDIHVSAPAEVTDVVRIGNSKLIQCLTPVHNTKWTALPPYIQKTPKKSAWEPPSVITPMHWQKTWPLTSLAHGGTQQVTTTPPYDYHSLLSPNMQSFLERIPA